MQILSSTDTESTVFRPRTQFGISVVSTDGYDNIRVQRSWDDGTTWADAHTDDFADDALDKIFDVPRGVVCRINNPDGKAAVGYVGYVGPNAVAISIQGDILD